MVWLFAFLLAHSLLARGMQVSRDQGVREGTRKEWMGEQGGTQEIRENTSRLWSNEHDTNMCIYIHTIICTSVCICMHAYIHTVYAHGHMYTDMQTHILIYIQHIH